jgi:DMSO/TMAO reductase YedYZ molybdopterin-dependent catalytic subunit
VPRPQHSGLIVRQKSPLNLEYPFSALSDWLTPTDQFFVRNHFAVPRFDATTWRLTIDGAVNRPLALSLAELKRLPSRTLTAAVECAGNGRVFYEPAREGLQWQSGAVGNAAWTGVPLAELIDRAGARKDAVEVVLIGADRGIVDGGKKTASPGEVAFARSLPFAKARAEGTLLAYAMNDEPLTSEHGCPLRAVVPGWFGMAWVKWLAAIRIVDRPFLGYWQGRDYFRWDRSLGEPNLVPLSTMQVKAQIARPVQGAQLSVGARTRIFGAAWSGEAGIREGQVSTNEGDAWQPARLLAPEIPYAWRLWEYFWTPPEPGRYRLRCRAIDTMGNVQPKEQQSDRESYAANWVVPVEVTARVEEVSAEDV